MRGRVCTVLGALSLLALGPHCYSTEGGVAPPQKTMYYPVGLAVSPGGKALYVVNSDFDLQYDGGTVQAFDLTRIRAEAKKNAANIAGGCPGTESRNIDIECAPPRPTDEFWKSTVTIGAFATDIQLSTLGFRDPLRGASRRLFLPVRGNASLTWMDIADDARNPSADPFALLCGQGSDGRCDSAHQAGNNVNEPGNSRRITMPGEPFGMAQAEDGRSTVLTHQTSETASLLSTGLRGDSLPAEPPSLQFVADGIPTGGVGVAPIPHDPRASLAGVPPRPAFLHTSRAVPELSLLRYYSDEGVSAGSSLTRPFVQRESAVPVSGNASGVDSRGIVVDGSARVACKAAVLGPSSGRTQADVDADIVRCARLPARLFIASRSPASLLLGYVGEETSDTEGKYDPDRVTFRGSFPLSQGPSKLYFAPIVDSDGRFALRLFIVCFDAATIYIYDPELGQLENVMRVPSGPFAMAFDPYDPDAAARHDLVPDGPSGQKAYRYAYLASFTNSYVQVIDLDNTQPRKGSFEKVVLSLGVPTPPKGLN